MSSNTYGYIADTGPTQAYGSNNGVFDPADINDLIAENKWSGVGTLELIKTLSASNSSQTLEFDDVFSSTYNVYFITWSDYTPTNDENMPYFRLKNSSGEITSGYHYAVQEGNAGGTFSESNSTSATYLRIMGGGGSGTGENASGYIYVYNPNDSSKYTFTTNHTSYIDQNANPSMLFGSGVRPTADNVTGFMFRNISSGGTLGNINTLDISLYGIRYS
jgi:hypothetical protein